MVMRRASTYTHPPVTAPVGYLPLLTTAGQWEVRDVIEACERRIDRLNPEIQAVTARNPHANARATVIDDRSPTGPLHGVTVLVKDQFLTAGIPTSFGTQEFGEFVPQRDATVIRRLQTAGAVIIAKTNLPDWALGFTGHSSVVGQTKNPYHTAYDAGGSSAGTAAGVASGLATVGIGGDTGGSVRVPAAFCNLFGLRPTAGVVSSSGMSPLIPGQDVPGPIGRRVSDVATVLDVIADRKLSVVSDGHYDSYATVVNDPDFDDVSIGVLRSGFGDPSNPRERDVNYVCERAIHAVGGTGASIVDPVVVPELDASVAAASLIESECRWRLTQFLSGLEEAPYESVEEMYPDGDTPSIPTSIDVLTEAPTGPADHDEYRRKITERSALQRKLIELLSTRNLDALAFPTVQRGPDRHENFDDESPTYPVNTLLAARTGFPALSVPVGWTSRGLPVGLELLSGPYMEPKLLQLGKLFERHRTHRRDRSDFVAW